MSETNRNMTCDPEPGRSASILVVDDNAVNRSKMRLAVQNIGHVADTAEGGAKALEALRTKAYDAVLLDIVMPDVDGFDVLSAMKSEAALRDVPVIVISALENETESVVRAIELGAEDFLPKSFDPVLLRARLGASLEKKRFRDQEREQLRQLERLTEAAETLESGSFRPENLTIDDIAERGDGLGRLAAVFRGMAEEIYHRELKLTRSVQVLQGSLLVIAFGVAWGLTPSLSRMAAGLGSNPLGMAIWANGIAAAFCLAIAMCRGRMPRLSRAEMQFYMALALLVGVMQKLTIYWVTGYIDAALLSLLVTLQGIMVFTIAAALKLEKATPRRLAGLLVGLGGVGVVLFTHSDVSLGSGEFWPLVGLLVPLLMAVETVFLAARRPRHIDLFASVGLLMLFSVIILAPVAVVTGDLMTLSIVPGKLEVLILLLGIAGATSMLLTIHIVDTAGPVFAGQGAYAMTLAGIVWGMLLLDEKLSVLAWGAFAVILLGLYLVEPKISDEDFVLKRSFTRMARNRT